DGKYAFDIQERTAEKIVDFMKNPSEPPPPELEWEEQETSVLHLNDENMKNTLKKKKHALVMFYAPWCGHCKNAKPEFNNAAAVFKDNTKVAFCAVDCTKSQKNCELYEVRGYPTINYFNYGKLLYAYNGQRNAQDFINFMNDPEEYQKKQSAESEQAKTDPIEFWQELPGYEHVHLLKQSTFQSTLDASKKAIVMFYAPWCHHCKMSKGDYAQAALELADNKAIVLGAVDATSEQALAAQFNVQGFPAFKYFENGQLKSDYEGGRKREDFIQFLTQNSDLNVKSEL
ncbi:unnamed protein product, partial [Didymodactylos carnosus]